MRKVLSIFLIMFLMMIIFAVETVITDLSPIVPEYSAVKFLVENQIMDLDVNGNFKPSLLITRLDIAKVIYTVIQKYNLSKISDIEKSLANISDEIKIAKGLVSGIDKRLVNLETKQEELTQKIEAFDAFLTQSSETLFANIEKNYVKREDFDSLKAQITLISQVYNSQTKKFEEKINDIEKISEIEKKINIVSNQLEDLKTNFLEEQAKNIAKFSDIEKQLSNIPTNVTNLNVTVARLSNKVSSIEELYTKLSNIKASDIDKLENLSELEDKVNQMYSILTDLNAFSMDLDSLRKRLEGIDILTVRNVVNKFSILENRYQQIDSRVQYLENSVGKIELLNQKIEELNAKISDIENKKIMLDNLEKISNDVEELNKYKEDSKKALDIMSDKLVETNNNMRTILIVSIVSAAISVISFILTITK
ncbi:S-layer homology domain-containing protein [Thermosipho sp. (in: thermotogales)]|uniref:S-layer homology domain-containing protein n=1 Tax=Thermosipho sp. (in: thermotogales) TaxID=1968895 RepID=UPI0025803366|nr:S-layer homology domain-containing protein [Thermosipho sp. (in: thermotogales)]MBZ4650429.1 putative lipoprotein [Thermosipho sp. (in: thermotogales)]